VLGTAAVVIGLGLLVGIAYAFGGGHLDPSNISDRDFPVGDTTHMAKAIAKGGPLLFPDASPNKDRPIYVTHGGTNLSTQWLAILAFAPGQSDRKCALQWTGHQFQDPCSGHAYPGDGTGLTRYRTRGEGSSLFVDLRSPLP
jgi:hypothetical protein